MKFEKEIATTMIALMITSSTFIMAAYSAPALGTYPSTYSLSTGGSLPSIVVGSQAQTIDVVGAANIMAGLADAHSTFATGVSTGCSAITGKCTPNTKLGSSSGDAINGATLLGSSLQTIQVPQLLRPTVSNTTNSFQVTEQVKPPDAKVKTDTAQYSSLNGSLAIDMSIGSSPLEYDWVPTTPMYVIDTSVDATNGISDANPVTLSLMGQTFKISNVTANNKFTAFTGIAQTVSTTSPTLTCDANTCGVTYTLTITGSSNSGSTNGIAFTLSPCTPSGGSGTSCTTLTLLQGSTLNCNSNNAQCNTSTSIKIKATNVQENPSTGAVTRADLLVGPASTFEKTYSSGDPFPVDDRWDFTISSDATAHTITSIGLQYTPPAGNETARFVNQIWSADAKWAFGFAGLNVPNYATITVKPTTQVKVCNNAFNDTALGGYNGRPALWIHSDQPVFNNQSSTDAWIVPNTTLGEITLAYNDGTALCPLTGNQHAIQSAVRNTTSIGAGASLFVIPGINDQHQFTITIQNNGTANNVTETWLTLKDGGNERVNATFRYDANTANGYVLGYGSTTTSYVTTSYDSAATRKTDHEYDSTSSFGTITHMLLVTDTTNTLVMKLPTQQQTAIVYVGVPGASSGSSSSTLTLQHISGKIAYLDSDNLPSGALIVVGGPAVNGLTFSAWCPGVTGTGSPAIYKQGFSEGTDVASVCTSTPVSGFLKNTGKALIQSTDLSGHPNSIIVAGFVGTDTSTASQVLQNYADPSKGLVGKGTLVEVSGTSYSSVTVNTIAVPTTTTTTK